LLDLPATSLAKLRAQHPGALRATRQVTRFLCGIAAPALTKAKLTRHPDFGSASHIPFAHVAAAVKALS
jgi:ATP-dependent DNA helicase RecQ